jgi:ArsR family transcriptional regulator
LKTVAHPGRLRIICALIERELSASELARLSHLTPPALSQQAAILEAHELIARRREGRSILYRLLAPETKALAALMYRLFCKPVARPVRRRPRKRTKT